MSKLPIIPHGTTGQLYSVLRGSPEPVLLIGAGASVKSGVLLAADMAERAARWAYAKQLGRSWEDPRLLRSDWLPWMREQPWFDPGASIADNYPAAIENLLQPRQARADFFRKLLQTDVRPSPGYERLVEFMHQGFIKTVLTTNFDALLTETQVLVRRPHYINVIQTASDYTKFSTSPQYPQEVFLHGSVDHYTDKNIVDEVQRLDPDLVNMVVPLLRDHPLIVVGYRGTEASVMEHLLLENATLAHEFRHGIFWCKLKSEQDHDLSSRIQKLAQAIAKNFTVVDIDGFDELFARDLWQLHQDAEPVLPSKMTVVAAAAPTLDMEVVQVAGLDELDWPTVQARIVQYCGALQIPAPSSLDRKWIIDRLLQLNLALGQDGKDHHLTTAGCLLFSQKPQSVVPDARVVLRATGDAQWLERALGEKEPFGRNEPVAQVERVIEGSLWTQYDQINDVLAAFNRPFRLKGEQSETVLPYPPLALKEVIVNALVHRDYDAARPIYVEVTPSSVRVTNPGGLVPEVQRRVEAGSIEEEIRRGRRGIKGYRNPVLADLFYGSGEMDKAGSGLSDVLRFVRSNGGDVKFGPTDANDGFDVLIMSRPEAVDEVTGTAAPTVLTNSRYAANLLEVTSLPHELFHAGTSLRRLSEVWAALPGVWLPPLLLLGDRLYTFHDFADDGNPLRQVVDVNDVEALSIAEFTADPDGQRRLVTLLNLGLEKHLRRLGLIVDTKRKRAYFPRTVEGQRAINYQARLRKARRTVVKARVSPRTQKVTYWEHEAIGYRFEKFGVAWGLFLDPSYVFTFDGAKGLLASEKVNRLSTKRAARDYNPTVLNDLSFWAWVLSSGRDTFALDLAYAPPLLPHDDDENDDRWADVRSLEAERSLEVAVEAGPQIALLSRLVTISVNDIAPPPGEDVPTADPREIAELEEELEELAEEQREEAKGEEAERETEDVDQA
jgi:hypothetical protein